MSLTNSYAFRRPLLGVVINLALLASLGLLFYGLQAPILTLEKFYFFSNTVSLLSALQQLAAQAEWGLFALVGMFSVVFPILKSVILLLVWNFDPTQGERHRRHLRWLATYGKWSMLDVFIVAVLVVAVKLGAIASVEMRYGLYAFAAAVLLTMIITARVVKLIDTSG